MELLRPNEERAKTAIILIWVILVLEVVSLLSSYFQYDLLQTAAHGGAISTETAEENDNRETIIAVVYSLARLVSGITFIMWFRRAYFNLHLRVNKLSHTEGWAAGSWFVPYLNLYRPYQIMKELYEETKKLSLKAEISSNQTFATNYLGVWWTLWIIGSIIGQFVFRYSLKAETIEQLTTATTASMLGNIVGIPLALITVRVIQDYCSLEKLSNETVDNDDDEDEETT